MATLRERLEAAEWRVKCAEELILKNAANALLHVREYEAKADASDDFLYRQIAHEYEQEADAYTYSLFFLAEGHDQEALAEVKAQVERAADEQMAAKVASASTTTKEAPHAQK